MKVFLIVLLLIGCAAAPVYQERFTEPWIAVAEIKLSDWEKLNAEQKARVVMIVMTTYYKRTECYRANLRVLFKNGTLVFAVKCIERMVQNEGIKGSVGEITAEGACGDGSQSCPRG